MIIEDYTIDKKFSELKEGTCFVMYSEYYMKIWVKFSYENSDTVMHHSHYAVNLKTGVAMLVNSDNKVRVVSGKMLIE